MKLDLPSGATVEIRDKLKGKDKFAVQKAISFNINAAGQMDTINAGVMTVMINALLAKLIESWTLDLPLPRDSEAVFDELDLDDYIALESVARPLIEKVTFSPNQETPSG